MELTRYLAKLAGLSIVLMVLGLMVDKPASIAALNALFDDPPLMFVTGVFTMMIGLAVVLGHNRWSGGLLPVLVTIYGWIALIKGATFVWMPAPAQAAFYRGMHFEQYFYVYLIGSLVPATYLIVAGFRRPQGERK